MIPISNDSKRSVCGQTPRFFLYGIEKSERRTAVVGAQTVEESAVCAVEGSVSDHGPRRLQALDPC